MCVKICLHAYGFICVLNPSRDYLLQIVFPQINLQNTALWNLHQTKLSQASLQQVTSSSSLSTSPLFLLAIPWIFVSSSTFAEHPRAASQLFKLMTDCNENKHGQSVLIFFFQGLFPPLSSYSLYLPLCRPFPY